MNYNFVQKVVHSLSWLTVIIKIKTTLMLLECILFMLLCSHLNSNHRYEQLVKFYPEVDDYKLYYAQSLYKEGKNTLIDDTILMQFY